jgi:hypothetical protein
MTMPASFERASRREFLRGTGRYGFLTVILATAGWNLRKGQECLRDRLCAGCPVIDRCDLPRAVITRQGES